MISFRFTFLTSMLLSLVCLGQADKAEIVLQSPHQYTTRLYKVYRPANLMASVENGYLKIWDLQKKALLKSIFLENNSGAGYQNISFIGNPKQVYLETIDTTFLFNLEKPEGSKVVPFKAVILPRKDFPIIRFLKDKMLFVSSGEGKTLIGTKHFKTKENEQKILNFQADYFWVDSDARYLAAHSFFKGEISFINLANYEVVQNFKVEPQRFVEVDFNDFGYAVVKHFKGRTFFNLNQRKIILEKSREISKISIGEDKITYYENGEHYSYDLNTGKTQVIAIQGEKFHVSPLYAFADSRFLYFSQGYPVEFDTQKQKTFKWGKANALFLPDFVDNKIWYFLQDHTEQPFIFFDIASLGKHVESNKKKQSDFFTFKKDKHYEVAFDFDENIVLENYSTTRQIAEGTFQLKAFQIKDLSFKEAFNLNLGENLGYLRKYNHQKKQVMFARGEANQWTYTIVDVKNNKILKKINSHLPLVSWKDDLMLTADALQSEAQLRKISNNQVIWETKNRFLNKPILTKDSKFLLTLFFEKGKEYLSVFDIAQKKEIHQIAYAQNVFLEVFYDVQTQRIFAADRTGQVQVWQISNFEKKQSFQSEQEDIRRIERLGKWIVTEDNYTKKFWDATSFQLQFTLFSVQDDKNPEFAHFAVMTPDGYYYAEKNILDKIKFRVGLKIYDFDQFDLQYNRPDIVLERIGLAPKELIESYRKAYEKRLKKLNFDPKNFEKDRSFNVPEVDFPKRKGYFEISKTPIYELAVSTQDARYALDRLNVYVNGVPLYGKQGKSLREKKTQKYSENLQIALSQGRNLIEVSVLNEKGVESLKERIEVDYEPAVPRKPVLHLVTIGVSEYANSQMNLKYARKDGEDLAKMLQTQKGVFSEVKHYALFNKDVSREQVQALKQKLARSSVDDVVWIFVSGHGLLDKDYDYYLATYEVDFGNPSAKGLRYEELEELIESVPARQRLLMIDACHSGEIDKDEITQASQSESLQKEGLKFRNFGTNIKNKNVGLANSYELSKQLFTDLRKGVGATVLSAAAGVELAQESDKWQNGAFTYCLLQGLQSGEADSNKDGAVMLSELQKYLYESVPKLTGGLQQPTSRIENLVNDFRIW
ncbi:caspase family protein [Raineya sp.]|jgi:uncharacterized caspase-like protein/WD40 repeat protein